MKTISLSLSQQQIDQLVSSFSIDDIKHNVGNVKIQIKADECNINIYSTNKVVFQGNNAEFYSEPYAIKKSFISHAGSDEVGTGDFFGPICVCGCAIDELSYNKLKEYKFDDSKKLTDNYIINIVEKVKDFIPHSLIILDNEKYNEVINENNMNAIKAKMHNQVYLNMIKKGIDLPNLIVIDDFCGKEKYYEYLNNTKDVIHNITFETKAESKYLAVAVASMIARYGFLKYMESLNLKYNCKFPLGATNVDDFAKDFVKKYGKEELKKVCKLNFKNTQRII